MENLRQLSMIFSPAMFKKIVRDENYTPFQKKTEKFLNIKSTDTNLDIVKRIYKQLLEEYRCEYVYKNKLFLEIIKEHSLKETLIFNEFKVGKSQADLVMLNGCIRIFEVKTELDNLEKLSKQIIDYQKIAEEVSVVTDEKYGSVLEKEYKGLGIGILVLNDNNKLTTLRKPKPQYDGLEYETLFKILRKQEYLDLLMDNYGAIPNVPNTKIFKESFSLLSEIDIRDFQKQVLRKLKERKLKKPNSLKSKKTPVELKHICNSLNFDVEEYEKLYNFLKIKSLCTNPM